MTILGSRDKMCIHQKINPRNGIGTKAKDVNGNCRIRVSNTEKFRSRAKKAMVYDDNIPPLHLPGDDDNENDSRNEQDDDPEGKDNDPFMSKSFKTCAHYRQLTKMETARSVHANCFPGPNVNNTSQGGEATRLGSHDIEDLVNVGKDTGILYGVAIYRISNYSGFGLTLKQDKSLNAEIIVKEVKKSSPAAIEGTMKNRDVILRINGKSVKGWTLSKTVDEIRETGEYLLLDIQRPQNVEMHSACPYYLSRKLTKTADIVFAPYNYVLDPHIRQIMDLKVEDAVVILDEAHNVESTLRESGCGNFGEIELCELLVFLNGYAVHDKYELTVDRAYPLCDVAHQLLLFVENLILCLRDFKDKFENEIGAFLVLDTSFFYFISCTHTLV